MLILSFKLNIAVITGISLFGLTWAKVITVAMTGSYYNISANMNRPYIRNRILYNAEKILVILFA